MQLICNTKEEEMDKGKEKEKKAKKKKDSVETTSNKEDKSDLSVFV